MFLKQILLFLFMFKICTSHKSLTIVLDTTKSMQDELDILKVNLGSAIDLNEVRNVIDSYILVPFNDPDASNPLVAQTPFGLVTAVNRLTASGGDECPENSLTAIERALQISKPKSNIFVFTDAYPKDIEKLRSIENLCMRTRSQVVFFVTGYCLPTSQLPFLSVQTYYDVAKACTGTVFRLDAPDLNQVFKYMKEVIKEEWTSVISYDYFTNSKEIAFSVNSFTKSVLLAVSGKHPSVIISPVANSSSTFDNIIESRYGQVINILQASPGEYRVMIRSQGTTSVVLYQKVALPLQIGFSTLKPRSIIETSYRPLPDRTNYLLIQVSSSFKVENIAIEVFGETENKTLDVIEIVNDKIYLTKTLIEPDKSFCIWIHGYDKLTSEKISGSTVTLIPQITVINPIRRKPRVQLIEGDSVTVDFGTEKTIACKVTAYPKPNIWWEDDVGNEPDTSETVLLEMPYLYISYVHIENVTKNFTMYCKCKNLEGEESKGVDIYFYRPYTFEVLSEPESQDIEYGTEGKLFCQVSAYPEAEIKWFYNESLITDMDDFEILPEENALVIKHMNLNNVGQFKCEISNEVNEITYTAYIGVSGLEAPQVEVDDSNISLKLEDWTTLKCRVTKGKPSPNLSWEFKSESGYDFGLLPANVMVNNTELNIMSAQTVHSGTYRCHAKNVEGHNSVDINVVVQSPPTILDSEYSTIQVKEGEDVELKCNVTASPSPTVRWEISQDDVLIALDDRHQTDEYYTHRFKALWKDSGNYHCVAENSVGRAEKTITLNVLVKPYIETPRSKVVTMKAGDALALTCNVSYGNPVPTTKWEFTAVNSPTRVIKRSNSSSVLYVDRVQYSDEGLYVCVADNEIGTDIIKTHVKVQ